MFPNLFLALNGYAAASASLGREGTPKQSNFEKTMSLYDITSAEDGGLTLSVPRDRRNTGSGQETSRSDPGTVPCSGVSLVSAGCEPGVSWMSIGWRLGVSKVGKKPVR